MTVQIVSEQSDLDKERALAEAEWSYLLREMTSNLLRIARGAGKSYYLIGQIADYARAYDRYIDAFGHAPSDEAYRSALRVDDPFFRVEARTDPDKQEDMRRWMADGTMDRALADDTIIAGALQIAASRLIGQKTQERAGEKQLHDGIASRKEAAAKGGKRVDFGDLF